MFRHSLSRTTESSLKHMNNSKLCTEESFACVLGILDDEPQSWWRVLTSNRKRDHDEGGRWRTERKLVKIMGTASVIFASVIFAENMSELLDALSL